MQKNLHPVLWLHVLTLFLGLTAYPQNPCTGPEYPMVYSPPPPGYIICNGECATLSGAASLTGGVSPFYYQWSSGATTQNTTMCPTVNSTYTVTVTDSNGCTATVSIPVTVNNGPVLDIVTSPASSGTNSIVLTATSVPASTLPTCTWSNGGSTVSVTVSPLSTTTYCVTCTNSMGCTATACEPVLSIITVTATCGECNGSLSLPNAGTYTLSGTGMATQTFVGPGNITGLCPGNNYTLSNTTGASNNIVVQNINLPFTADADFTTSIGNADVLYACTGQPIQFTAPTSNLSVQWDFGVPTLVNNTSHLPNPTYTYQNTGTYTVTLLAQGCTDADTLVRTIIVEQGIAPDIECASLECPGAEQTYSTPVVCDTYNWTVTGGTITAGQNTAEITVVWNDVAMGTVNLTVGDCDGSAICNPVGSIQVPIVSNNLPINGPDVVCTNTLALYSVPQYGGVQYTWSVVPAASGTIVWQQYNQAGVQWHTAAGVIQVSAVSSLVGCNSMSSMPVEVNQVYTLSGPDLVCRGAEVTYTASSGLHNWTVTGNASIVGSSANANSITVQVGLGLSGYTVSATPANPTQYCNYPQTITVTVGDQPAPPLILSSGYVCPGNAYTYQIASPASGISYFWNVTGGTPATGSGTSLSVTWAVGSPTYNIQVTAQSNAAPFCTASLGTNIPPLADLFVEGDSDLCAGNVGLYMVQPFLPDLTYTWEIDPPLAGSIISGQGTYQAEVQWNAGFPLANLSVSACNLSAALPVTIRALPNPALVESGILCAGSSIELSVLPAGFSQYQWQNGSSNATITISSGGSYAVTVTDEYGCEAVAVAYVVQHDLPSVHIYAEGIKSMCTIAPHNLNIAAPVSPGYTYQWLVNGSPAGTNEPVITHIGTSVPSITTYRVQVTDINGCQNLSNLLSVTQTDCSGGGDPPPTIPCYVAAGTSVDFTISPTLDCNTIDFINNSSPDALSFGWYFDFPGTDLVVPDYATQTYSYNQIGFYMTALSATFPSVPPSISPTCILSKIDTLFITHRADFDFSSPCLGAPTLFTDRSLQVHNTVTTSWNWDFGDGNTGVLQNPEHTYSAPGNYWVTLAISNDTCTTAITKLVSIPPLPNATFTAPAEVCRGTAIALIPAVAPGNVRWDWDFGDGSIISTKFPHKTYHIAGNYTLQLTVTDNRGCTNTYSQNITVLPVNNGVIGLTALTACEGQTITLTAPDGAAFLWSDSSTDNPLLAAQTGSYAVTVTQANGCTFNTPPVQLNFAPLPPANITPPNTPANLCPGNSLTLSANAGPGYAYAWTTGQSAPTIVVAHSAVPASGITVTVTVTDSQTGCSNVSSPININAINLPPPAINPNFPADLQLCLGETLTLTATHPTLSNFTWNNGILGNAITVGTSGNYAVVVTDANGCTNTAAVSVGVNEGGDMAPIPVGCYDYCELQPFSVPNVFAGYQWLLNGAPIAGANSPTFTPPQTGDYQLQITTIWGCQDISDALSLNLTDCLECLVSAAFTHTLNCSTIQLNSAGSSGNGVLSYSWDFGDGNTATTPNPSHSYTTSGNYTVCLTVANLAADGDTCTDTLCSDITIFTADELIITTDNLTDANCGEADGSISLTVSGNTPPYNYQWSDMNTDEDRLNLPAGVYDLTVTDSGGCSVVASFTIAELPLAASPLACLSATQTDLSVTWTAINGASGYELTINGGSPLTLLPDVTDYTFAGLQPDTEYTVSLVVVAPSPCINSLPTQVICATLPTPCPPNTPDIAAQTTPTPCGASEGSITLSITGGTAPYTYQWEDMNTDENRNNLPAGVYTVTVTDALGCSNTALATVEAYFTAPVIACTDAGDDAITVTWETITGAAGYQLWLNGDSLATLTDAENSYTFTNLLPDMAYTIGIVALASLDCEATSSQITCVTTAYVCAADEITAQITANTAMVQPGEPATLTATATGLTGNLSYAWTANDLPLACADSICIFTPDMPTTYAVTITDIYNCTASASLFMDVRMPNKVVAPNAFSPNGDAVNSLFRLAGFNVAEVQFSVWNRWGQKVYDSGATPDLRLGWDGTFNGQHCELGVYVFQATVLYTDGTTDWVQGNVTLIR